LPAAAAAAAVASAAQPAKTSEIYRKNSSNVAVDSDDEVGEPLNFGGNSVTAAVAVDTNAGAGGVIMTKEAALELQLAALEDAFALQERVLAENGRAAAAAALASAPPGTLPMGSSRSSSSGRSDAHSILTSSQNIGVTPIESRDRVTASGSGSSGSVEESVDCFPYLKMLQLWRRQAVRSAVERLQVTY
jgi:hypothetical protein